MPQDITFNQIAADEVLPGAQLEVDTSRASNFIGGVGRSAVLGQKFSTGTAADNSLTFVSDAAAADTLFGRGSPAATMAKGFLRNGVDGVTVEVLPTPANAEMRTVTLTYTGAATSGRWQVHVGSQVFSGSVGATVTATATAVAAAIEANLDSPFSAGSTAGVVTLTAKAGGVWANQVRISSSATGQTVAQAETQVGEGTAITAAHFTALENGIYDAIILQEYDTASRTAAISALGERWNPQTELYGHVWAAAQISSAAANASAFPSEATTAGNSRYVTVLAVETECPTPAYEVLAATAGQGMRSLRADAGLPLTTVQVRGTVAPAEEQRFTPRQRRQLLRSGYATNKWNETGLAQIERLTTSLRETNGAADNSFYEIQDAYILMVYLRTFNNFFETRYARTKLVGNGEAVSPGASGVVSPNSAKNDVVGVYSDLVALRLMQNLDFFRRNVKVQRDRRDRSRLNFELPLISVAQLRIVAGKVVKLSPTSDAVVADEQL